MTSIVDGASTSGFHDQRTSTEPQVIRKFVYLHRSRRSVYNRCSLSRTEEKGFQGDRREWTGSLCSRKTAHNNRVQADPNTMVEDHLGCPKAVHDAERSVLRTKKGCLFNSGAPVVINVIGRS